MVKPWQQSQSQPQSQSVPVPQQPQNFGVADPSFGGLDDASPSQSSDWFDANATYQVLVSGHKYFQGQEGPVWVTEAVVIESTSERHNGGETVAQVLKLQKHKSAPGELKAYLMALTEQPEAECGRQMAAWLSGDDQPMTPTPMYVETYSKPIKSRPGAEFTKIVWRKPTEAQAQEIMDKAQSM